MSLQDAVFNARFIRFLLLLYNLCCRLPSIVNKNLKFTYIYICLNAYNLSSSRESRQPWGSDEAKVPNWAMPLQDTFPFGRTLFSDFGERIQKTAKSRAKPWDKLSRNRICYV